MATIVMKYGLCAPHVNGDIVRKQMFLAHKYRNDLVQIAKARRDASRLLESERGVEVAACKQTLDECENRLQEAVSAVREARAKSRSRSETAEMNKAVKAARETRSIAKKAWQEARTKLRTDPILIERRKALTAETHKQGALAYKGYE